MGDIAAEYDELLALAGPFLRKYNPAQPRDPGGEDGGQWVSTPGGGGHGGHSVSSLLPHVGEYDEFSFHDVPELAAAMHDAFDGDFGGLTVRVSEDASKVYRDENGEVLIRAEGYITNADGRVVGSFRRHLYPESGHVHNDTLAIAKDEQGKGFASAFTAHSEEALGRLGFTRATVSASYAGGAAWARRYGWDTTKVGAAGDVPARLAAIGRTYQLSQQDKAQLVGWMHAFQFRDQDKWPTPRQVLEFGKGRYARTVDGREVWPGWEIMDGASWSGERPIGGGAHRAAGSYGRVAVAGDEWLRARAGRYLRQELPELPLDDEAMVHALIVALNELDEELRAAWDPGKHPRGPGGRFRSTVDVLKDLIQKHRRGQGKGDPFDGYDREQLRKVARSRGIELQRGEGRDSIAAKLLAHLGGEAPKPRPKRTPKPEPVRRPGADLQPLTKRELIRIQSKRKLAERQASLKSAKTDGERAHIEEQINLLQQAIDQEPGGWYNWDAPGWDDLAGIRVVGTPTAQQVREQVDRVMPTEDGMPAALRAELADELARQGDITPRSLYGLRRVNGLASFDHESNGSSMAYYRSDFRDITFNPRFSTDRANVDDECRRCLASGWWTRTDASHAAQTMAHEFGHHVSYRLFDGDARQRARLAKAMDDGLAANGWIVQHVKTSKDIKVSIDAWLDAGGRFHAANSVSRYGTHNSKELFAEVWAEYTTSASPRPHIERMGNAMRVLAEEMDIVER